MWRERSEGKSEIPVTSGVTRFLEVVTYGLEAGFAGEGSGDFSREDFSA